MSDERVAFNDDGTLDEVYAARGAHLEHMGGNNWFLIFYNQDGTEAAFWFKSKDLKRPFWETRPARPMTGFLATLTDEQRAEALAHVVPATPQGER